MKRLWICMLILLAGCSGSVRHPLDDSETRPPDAAAAQTEAEATLREVGAALLPDVKHNDTVWAADDGCATHVDAPEQGDVGRVIFAVYPTLPAGTTAVDVVGAAKAHWVSQGHTVGAGSSNMPDQAITRINGISYAVVDTPPGVEFRAFLPCYQT